MRVFPTGNDDNIFKRRHEWQEWGCEVLNNDFGYGNGVYPYELTQFWI